MLFIADFMQVLAPTFPSALSGCAAFGEVAPDFPGGELPKKTGPGEARSEEFGVFRRKKGRGRLQKAVCFQTFWEGGAVQVETSSLLNLR